MFGTSDSNNNGAWLGQNQNANGGAGYQGYLVMDLGFAMPVVGFASKGRGSNAWQFVERFEVSSGNSLTGPWTVETNGDIATGVTGSSNPSADCFLAAPVTTRYIKIRATRCGGSNNACIIRIAVYVPPHPPSPPAAPPSTPPPPTPPVPPSPPPPTPPPPSPPPPPPIPPLTLLNPGEASRRYWNAGTLQSTPHNCCSGGSTNANIATGGSCNGAWLAQASNGGTGYLVIDLGSSRTIYGFRTQGRGSNSWQYVERLELSTGSAFAGPFTVAASDVVTGVTGSANPVENCYLSSPVTSRYVKIRATRCGGSNNACIICVAVWAS